MRRLAFDFGSETVRMSGGARRPVIVEPAVVAHREHSRAVVAVGRAAAQMWGRTPAGLTAERPFTGGGVRSPMLARALLRSLMQRAQGRGWQRPDLVVALPAAATTLDRRAYQRLAQEAGAARVQFAPLSACRALGLDLPLFSARGTLIIDVGAGRTSVDLLSLGAPVSSVFVDGAGEELDRAISRQIRQTYGLLIGELSAHDLKHRLLGMDRIDETQVHGRDMATGLPRSLSITRAELDPLVQQFALRIALKVQEMLRDATPELSADLSEDGFWLTGGGANLFGLRSLLPHLLDLPVQIDEHPDESIGHGLARLLDPKVSTRLLEASGRPRRH